MDYKTKSGFVLTEEMLEEMGEACERGEYPGLPGSFVVAPQGRPALYDEELVTVAFKLPLSYRVALDKKAAARNKTRSQFLRDAVDRAIRQS